MCSNYSGVHVCTILNGINCVWALINNCGELVASNGIDVLLFYIFNASKWCCFISAI